VPRVEASELTGSQGVESSSTIRERVLAARAIQAERYRGTPFRINADLDGAALRRFCTPTPEAARLVQRALTSLALSARAHDKILKVARTLADLTGAGRVESAQVGQAIAFRTLDRSTGMISS
jgi:magnesium chelatase family protein